VKTAQRQAIEKYAGGHMAKLELHGWPHVKRTARLCKQIAVVEKAQTDLGVLETAALLHDIAKHLENEIKTKGFLRGRRKRRTVPQLDFFNVSRNVANLSLTCASPATRQSEESTSMIKLWTPSPL
jgi:hypothetical protein